MQDKAPMQDQLKQLPDEIQKMALSLLGFTEGLKTCFTAADACGEPLFKDLRSLLVGDAKIYFHAVCPLTKEVMYDIHKFFNVLGVLDSVEKFKKSFNYIITETAKIIEKLTLCEQLHLETLTTANHRDIVAQKLAKTLGLREKIENEKAEAAEKQRKAAEENAKNAKAPWWMWAIPGAGVIIGTVVTKSIRADYEKLADSELQKTMAAKERGSVAAMAANLISNTVVPALRDYIENIQGVIKILTKIQIEVKEVNDNTKDAQSMGDNNDMVEIFLDAVNKNIASIKQTTSDMIAYYKICEAAVTAFDSLQDAKDYVYDALEKVTEVKAEPETLWSRMKKVLTSKKGIMTQIEGILTKDGKF